MRKIPALILTLLSLISTSVFAQSDTLTIEERFQLIDEQWHGLEPTLDNYSGFRTYCTNSEYRNTVINVMKTIHHYDTTILQKLNDPTYVVDRKERKATLRKIEKFETKYSTKAFLQRLNRECHEWKEIEHDRDATKNDFADNSYDGQKLILEVELSKYAKQVTKIIDHINNHIHHLRLADVSYPSY